MHAAQCCLKNFIDKEKEEMCRFCYLEDQADREAAQLREMVKVPDRTIFGVAANSDTMHSGGGDFALAACVFSRKITNCLILARVVFLGGCHVEMASCIPQPRRLQLLLLP